MSTPAESPGACSSVAAMKLLVEELAQQITAFVVAQDEAFSCDGTLRNNDFNDTDVEQLAAIMDTLDEAASQIQSLCYRVTVSLQKEENKGVPINRLPIELLGQIFQEAVGDRSLSITRPFTLEPPDPLNRSAIRLMSVCCHWRAVAEGLSRLWTTIVTEKELTAELSLRTLHRARDAPLEVYIRRMGSVRLEVLDDLSSRCGQLRKFHVAYAGRSDDDRFARFNSEAPLLTSLCVGNNEDFALPLLFNGCTPALKCLTLEYTTQFSSNNFSNLTRFHLIRQRFLGVVNFMDMLAVLQRSPALKEYALEHAITSFDLDDSDVLATRFPKHSIALPMLTRVSFVSTGAAMTCAIIRLLELRNTALAFNLFLKSEPRTLEYLLLSGLRSAWAPLQSTFTTLHLFFDRNLLVAANRACAVRVYESLVEDGDVQDTFYRPRQLFHYANLQSLSLLSTDTLVTGSESLWREVFANLSSLTRLFLRLSKPSNYELWFEALATRELGYDPYPAPALRELCITSPSMGGNDLGLLSFLVTDRHQTGHPLRTLQIVYEKTGSKIDQETYEGFMFWKGQKSEYERYVHEVRFEEHAGVMPGWDIPLGLETWDWSATP